MKRIASCLLLIAITLSLVACGPKSYEDIEGSIKLAFVDKLIEEGLDEASIDQVEIVKFLGEYRGSYVAVMEIKFPFYFFPEDGVSEINIDGIEFFTSIIKPLVVLKNDKIYQLDEAYEKGFLTRQEVLTVKSLFLSEDSSEQLFYGSYDGTTVYFKPNEEKEVKTVKISSVEFSFWTGGDIIVISGEQTYNLEEDIKTILKDRILTKKQIKTIKSIHDFYSVKNS